MINQADPLRNFKNFLFLIWHHLNLPAPTKRQYEIADFLQTCKNKRRMVQGFRGVGKSWITCAYVCWRLYCNPQLNLLVVSASKGKADEFVSFTKRLISEIPALQHLRSMRTDQRWSTILFDVGPAEADPNPSVKSAGITGQITGSRADEIIPDDIETPDNSMTQAMREKLAEKIKEFDSILKPGPDSRITYLGTPQSEASIYNLLPERGFEVRVWPARYPDEKLRATYGDRLAPGLVEELDANPALAGHSTDPERFTDLDLCEREAAIGRATFMLQFLLNTSLADADRYPLKLRDLVVTDLDQENGPERVVWAASPEWMRNDLPNVGIHGDRLYRPVPLPGTNYLPYHGKLLVIDPAGTGRDETGWAVLSNLHGMIFLLDAGGFPPGQGHAESTLEALARVALRYKVNRILIESNFGDGLYSKVLTPHLMRHYPCTIEPIKHNTQKERRICDTLEPVIQSHRLVVNASLVQRDHDSTQHYIGEGSFRYQLFYQLTRMTRDKGALAHDDRLDAVAMGVEFYARVMAADHEKKAAETRDRQREDDLKRYLAHAIGYRPKPLSYTGSLHFD